MKIFNFKKETKRDRILLTTALVSGWMWLLIVFVFRKVFVALHYDLFLLGILPNFFAAVFAYLILILKNYSKKRAALQTFGILLLAEIIQLVTPKTFDPLDIGATILGIICGELIIRLVDWKFKPPSNLY